LRGDDSELARLGEEAAALKTRMQAQNRAAAVVIPVPAPTKLIGEIFPVAQVDQQPKPTFQARPAYPAEFRSSGVAGEALIEFVVDAEGKVQNARAVSSSQPEFAAAAIAAVSKWEFVAGQKAGLAVNTQMKVPIVFTINKTPQPATKAANWF
jgi:TonB family protein